MKVWILYLIMVNVIAVLLMYIDKKKAVANQYRISEKALITTATCGGGFGILYGMNAFKHKTRKAKFVYGIPAIILVQVIILIKLVYFR